MGYHLGVDLGTTFTAAAAMDGGTPTMVGLGNRALQIPSVLYLLPDGSVLVGEAAELRSSSDPARAVREFKRRIGDPVPILVGGRPFSAQALSARLLRWVVDKATEQLGEPPVDVTLTYPANWAQFKVDLLRQVAVLADLETVRACSEPEAAALQYASRTRVAPGDRIAVYDLGGGTFDVCALEKTTDGFRILGRPEGIEHLGGIDFDEAVFRRVVDQLPPGGFDPDSDDDAGQLAALARLRRDCVDAKEALSTDVEAIVPVGLPHTQTSIRLTRGEFEDIIRPAIEETIGATRRALRSADTDPSQLLGIVLVGGSSRIPLIAELLGNTFRCPVAVDTHPKNDVAAGAARAGSLPQGAMTLLSATDHTAPLTGRGLQQGGVRPDSVTRPGFAMGAAAGVAASSMGPPPSGAPSQRPAPPPGWAPPDPRTVSAQQPPVFQPGQPAPGQQAPGQPAPGQQAPGQTPGSQQSGPPQPGRPQPGPPRSGPPHQPSDQPRPAPASPDPDRDRRNRIVLIAVAVVVLLAGVGTVGALKLGGSNGEGSSASAPSTSAAPASTSVQQSSAASSTSPAPSSPSSSSVASTSVQPTAGVSPQGLPVSEPLPDRTIVVAQELDGAVDLVAVDADTGARSPIVAGSEQDRMPSLSPDRESIIYIEQSGTTRSPRVVAANGAGDRALAESAPAGCDRVNRIAWNPVQPTEIAGVCLDQAGVYSLQIARVDGTAVRTLATGLTKVDDVSYSPDGSRLVFWGSDPSSFDGGSIYVMSAAGDAPPQQLTTQPAGIDADPVWSPDGSQIALRRRLPGSTPQGNFAIFVMGADGSNPRQLTDDPVNDQEPSWSPDGASIAFVSGRGSADGAGKLWVMTSDGQAPREVVGQDAAAKISAPAWSRR